MLAASVVDSNEERFLDWSLTHRYFLCDVTDVNLCAEIEDGEAFLAAEVEDAEFQAASHQNQWPRTFPPQPISSTAAKLSIKLSIRSLLN